MESPTIKFGLPPPLATLRLCVIVPAKNEEHTIEKTLTALYQQVDAAGEPIDKRVYEVIVLANNCTDATVAVARQFAVDHPDSLLHVVEHHLPAHQAHIGFVRRVLMDEAYRRLMRLGRRRGIIASTDGDTVVSSTWIHHTLSAIYRGADVVGGRIIAQPQKIGRLYYLQDVTYRYLQAQVESIIDPDLADPWPRHFQNFGPSLAVTAELYERAGRMPVLPALEDVRFYEALQRCDARIRHCPRVQVLTSSRVQGRVAFGFSVQLQQWEHMTQQGLPLMVPGADYWITRFTWQKQLRCAWQRESFTLLQFVARSLMLSPYELYDRMRRTAYFGELWHWLMALPEVESLLTHRFAPVDIACAIADLRQYVRQVRPLVAIRPDDTDPSAGDSSARVMSRFVPGREKPRARYRRLADNW